MPPPKKPKTGLSRVEEFLSASEKEELASQGSVHSPDCSSPSHTEELVWRPSKAQPVVSSPSSTDMLHRQTSSTAQEYTMMEPVPMPQSRAQPHPEGRSHEEYNGSSRRLVNLMQTRKVDALFHALQASSPPPTMDSFCRPPPALQPLRDTNTSTSYPPQSQYRCNDNMDYPRSSVSPSSPRYDSVYERPSSAEHVVERTYSPPRMERVTSPRMSHIGRLPMDNDTTHSNHTTRQPLDHSLMSVGSYAHWPREEEEEERESVRSKDYNSPPASPRNAEQEAPLDFSQTAKSVLARMMASATTNLPTPPRELLLPPSREYRTNSLSSPTHAWPAAPLSPSSDDSRSLSPGEWRPGMPPSVANINHNVNRYQTEAPPSSNTTNYHITDKPKQLAPSSGQNANWKGEHYTQLPSGGQTRQWEPEESATCEVKEPTISSTSNDQHQPKSELNTSPPPTVQEMPTSTMTDDRRVGRPRYMDKPQNCTRRCQICNDMASGFHYGVWSCEGCKAFFKRSLQGQTVDYVCPATNSCTIDKHRRKSCQACRLRKCIEMGMNRGKKGPRGPRGPNKRKLLENGQHPMPMSDPSEPRIKIKKEILDSSEPVAPVPPMRKCAEIHRLAEYLIKIDPPTRNSGHDNSLQDNEVNITSSLMKLADTELVDVINWAKSIPGYTDLQLRDRIHLLEASWMEILMMGILWRSHPHSADNILVFAPDLHINKQRSSVSGIGSVCEKMFGLATKFSSLQINKEEFVLLRTLLLFNAEIADLPSCSTIESLREKLIEALQYTSCERLHKSPERVAHLLLFLPHIRQCSLTAISRMFELGRKHQAIPSFELLQEMIEARSPIALPPVMSRRLLDTANTSQLSPPQLSPHASHIPSSPPVGMGAPNHYNAVSMASHLNTHPENSVAVSTYHMTLPQPRMSHNTHHHQQQQQQQLPPQQQQQQQQQPQRPSPPLSLPHPRYPPMPYPPTSYPHQQK